MSMLTRLSEIFGDAFEKAGVDRSFGAVVVSQRPDLAQFQCNGALPAAKAAERNPRQLAQDVMDNVVEREPFSELSVAGPGFINITLSDAYLAGYVAEVAGHDKFGHDGVEPERIIVDYGGTNVAKEMHVGHLRPSIIGESVKRLFRFVGHDVLGDIHLGDWGAPMGQLIVELESRLPDLPYFDAEFEGPYPDTSPVTIEDLQEMYPVAAAKAREDPATAEMVRRATFELQQGRPGYRALWQHFRDVSIDSMRQVFGMLGVEFELWYGESTIADRLEPMIQRMVEDGYAVESDGALIVEVAEPDDQKEIPPLILVTSHGATLYNTWDVATIEDRIEDLGAKQIIYVVDVRQALHFEQVFRTVRKVGIAGPDVHLELAGNGTVNGPDGKPLRTRDGGLPLLRGLIQDVIDRAAERLEENDMVAEYDDDEAASIARLVGLAALKYGDLHNHRTSNYIFDIERFTSFEGKTGPYLLYSAVRIKSILRNAHERGLEPGPVVAPRNDGDRGLMLELARFPDVIDRAVEHRAPNHVAEYAYDLATAFNRFYEKCHILNEEDRQTQGSWLALVALTLRAFETLLDLLLIEIPERM